MVRVAVGVKKNRHGKQGGKVDDRDRERPGIACGGHQAVLAHPKRRCGLWGSSVAPTQRPAGSDPGRAHTASGAAMSRTRRREAVPFLGPLALLRTKDAAGHGSSDQRLRLVFFVASTIATLASAGRREPARGVEDFTRRRVIRFGLVTLPRRQCARPSNAFAPANVRRASLGTTQRALALTTGAGVVVTAAGTGGSGEADGGVGSGADPELEGNGGLVSAVIAASMSSRPPVTVFPASDGVASTLCRIADLTALTVADGISENSSAAAPLTIGVAIEVPLRYA